MLVRTTASSYVSLRQMHQTWNINNLPKMGEILLHMLFFDPVVLVLFQDLVSCSRQLIIQLSKHTVVGTMLQVNLCLMTSESGVYFSFVHGLVCPDFVQASQYVLHLA